VSHKKKPSHKGIARGKTDNQESRGQEKGLVGGEKKKSYYLKKEQLKTKEGVTGIKAGAGQKENFLWRRASTKGLKHLKKKRKIGAGGGMELTPRGKKWFWGLLHKLVGAVRENTNRSGQGLHFDDKGGRITCASFESQDPKEKLLKREKTHTFKRAKHGHDNSEEKGSHTVGKKGKK